MSRVQVGQGPVSSIIAADVSRWADNIPTAASAERGSVAHDTLFSSQKGSGAEAFPSMISAAAAVATADAAASAATAAVPSAEEVVEDPI